MGLDWIRRLASDVDSLSIFIYIFSLAAREVLLILLYIIFYAFRKFSLITFNQYGI